MKATPILSALACLLVAASVCCPVASAKTAPKPKAAKVSTYAISGEVIEATDTKLVLKGEDGQNDRKYVLTPNTKYVNAGKPATANDLHLRHWVGLTLVRTPSGMDEVTLCDVGAKHPIVNKKKH